jgi:hypothetical protein
MKGSKKHEPPRRLTLQPDQTIQDDHLRRISGRNFTQEGT